MLRSPWTVAERMFQATKIKNMINTGRETAVEDGDMDRHWIISSFGVRAEPLSFPAKSIHMD